MWVPLMDEWSLAKSLSWSATTQLMAQEFRVNLVSKTAQKAGFAGFSGL